VDLTEVGLRGVIGCRDAERRDRCDVVTGVRIGAGLLIARMPADLPGPGEGS
jgi:hypothetical protein